MKVFPPIRPFNQSNNKNCFSFWFHSLYFGCMWYHRMLQSNHDTFYISNMKYERLFFFKYELWTPSSLSLCQLYISSVCPDEIFFSHSNAKRSIFKDSVWTARMLNCCKSVKNLFEFYCWNDCNNQNDCNTNNQKVEKTNL